MINRLALALLLAGLTFMPNSASANDGTLKKLFSCSFGKKHVTVTSVGRKISYQFGVPGRIEMALAGHPASGNVFWHQEVYAHSSRSQLRFKNGVYSYILFNRWASPSYSSKVGEDSSGLIVTKGGKTVARMNCKRSEEFDTDLYDFASLPDDRMFDHF